ncbi:MAG: hypothetical protein QOE92_2144 [Chloroflexota bacterium]|jgi:hypothetical protein|nr:hypothetical protein [Chloroflexota bacterium]
MGGTDPGSGATRSSGASRRDFLAGAGLTGAAAIAAGALPLRALAAGDAALPPLPVTADQRGSEPASRNLIVDGTAVAYLKKLSGGEAFADVVVEAAGPDHVRHKHLATTQLAPLVATVGREMGGPLAELIASTLDGNLATKEVASQQLDINRHVTSQTDFGRARMVQLVVPKLAADSKDVVYFDVTLAAGSASTTTPGGTAVTTTPTQKAWVASNFRVDIPGLPCARVASIDPLTVKVTGPSAGEKPGAAKSAANLEISNLVMAISMADYPDWEQWHQDFVVRGQNDAGHEKNGKVQLLAADMSTVLATLTLSNLGLFNLSTEFEANSAEKISRFTVEMYIEKLGFALTA